MTETSKAGLGVLGGALILGVAGDGLLRVLPWGINAPLWVGLLALLAVALANRFRLSLSKGSQWLLLTGVGFAAALAWRDSPIFTFLNLSASLTAVGLAGRRTAAPGSAREAPDKGRRPLPARSKHAGY